MLASGLDPDEWEAAAEHELGHVIQGDTAQAHILDPEICPTDPDGMHLHSKAIMCVYLKQSPGVTDADRDFVLGAEVMP